MNAETIQKIQSLHAEYERLTGFKISLIAREFAWADWVRRGLTVEDLRMWISEIRDRRRRGGNDSLHFRNAIQDVDRAEENIIELRLRKHGRPPRSNRQSVLESTGRTTEKFQPVKSAGDIAAAITKSPEEIEAARRRAAEHLAQFKKTL